VFGSTEIGTIHPEGIWVLKNTASVIEADARIVSP